MGNELIEVNEKNIGTAVSARIKELQKDGEIHFPANYSPQNAMKSAWLILQETKDKNKNKALDVCTKESICNALLDMVIQGLSPAKNQCYFIVYGNVLSLARSYFGTMAVTKRVSGVKHIAAEVVYEGDEFEYAIEMGVKKIKKHIPNLDNIDKTRIKAAYCIILKNDGDVFADLMNIAQLKQAWLQSRNYPIDQQGRLKDGSVHFKFTEEMAKKTVINRTCKMFLNTSDDSDMIIGAVNRTTANEYREPEIELEPDPDQKNLLAPEKTNPAENQGQTQPETPPQTQTEPAENTGQDQTKCTVLQGIKHTSSGNRVCIIESAQGYAAHQYTDENQVGRKITGCDDPTYEGLIAKIKGSRYLCGEVEA